MSASLGLRSGSWGSRSRRGFSIAGAGGILSLAFVAAGCSGGCTRGATETVERSANRRRRRWKSSNAPSRPTIRPIATKTPESCWCDTLRGAEKISESSEFSLAVAGPDRLRMPALRCAGRLRWPNRPRHDRRSAGRGAQRGGARRAFSSIGVPRPRAGQCAEPHRRFRSVFIVPGPGPSAGPLEQRPAPRLDSPKKIGAGACYRVRIDKREGPFVLWIDEQTFVVRRVETPRPDIAGCSKNITAHSPA